MKRTSRSLQSVYSHGLICPFCPVGELRERGPPMMGQKVRLFTPVSALSLDELVPVDHCYRHMDRVLDLSFGGALPHNPSLLTLLSRGGCGRGPRAVACPLPHVQASGGSLGGDAWLDRLDPAR
jgi:hypothetical protein